MKSLFSISRVVFLMIASIFIVFATANAADTQADVGTSSAGYPRRAIRLIVPYAAHSDTDLYARNLASSVKQYLDHQTILVENQPGDAGITGSMAVRNAPADGYTLLIGRLGTHALQPALDPRTPYRWYDFSVLAILEFDPLICVVDGDSPYRNARELLSAIRKQPGTLKYGAAGVNTLQNVATQYLLSLAGAKPDAAEQVNLTNSLEVTQSLLNGRIHFACNLPATMMPHIKAGKLLGLFTTSPARLADLPGVPTAHEVGLQDMERMKSWAALMAPLHLPEAVIQRWQEALGKLAKDPAWLAGNARLGGVPAIKFISNPTEFVKEQYEFFDQFISLLGIR
ncbi:putative tricarboxylic transport membrane protein [Gammaproteobacteria bacterium]